MCIFFAGMYKRDLVRHIVLDEADTLLDDSFNEQLKYFLSKFAVSISNFSSLDRALFRVRWLM